MLGAASLLQGLFVILKTGQGSAGKVQFVLLASFVDSLLVKISIENLVMPILESKHEES